MKRLVKYLFSGFICSALLMGCESGQEVEINNNDTVIEETTEVEVDDLLFHSILQAHVDAYNNPNDTNPSSANYLRVKKDRNNISYNIEVTMGVNGIKQLSYDEMFDMIHNVFIREALIMYKELYENDYYKAYERFDYTVKFTDGNDTIPFFAYSFYEDSVTRSYMTDNGGFEVDTLTIPQVEIVTNYDVWSMLNDQDVPDNTTPIVEEEEEIIETPIEEEQEETHEIYVAGYPAYYTSSNDGESVLNIVIDNDCMQVADIEYYYNESLGAAMGCRYVVLIFGDGSNCVIENNGPSEIYNSYKANVDLSFYGN